MAKFDVEDVMNEIQAKIVASFNSLVTALNAEKNDGITLPQIDTTNGIFWFLCTNPNVKDPYVTINISEWSDDENSGSVLSFEILVWKLDESDKNIEKMVLRYLKVLREIFRPGESFNQISLSRVGSINYFGVDLGDPQSRLKSAGVTLDFHFGY